MCFTELYLKTTNPENQTVSNDILKMIICSVIFHTAIYTLFLNLVKYIFSGTILSKETNTRLVIALLVIMILGFTGRYFHVRDIYKAYNYDKDKTRAHLDKLYVSWLFMS